jgi:hypothetical protein
MDVTVKLPQKLNEQYKFIDNLEEFVYENPEKISFEALLVEKRIPKNKLLHLAGKNSYVADKIANILDVMSTRWQTAWVLRDSDYREDPSGKMFRYYNKEYESFLRESITDAIKRKSEVDKQLATINIIEDPIKQTEAMKEWKDSEAKKGA